MLLVISKIISSTFISPPKLGDSISISHDRLQVEFAKTVSFGMQRRRRTGRIFSTGPLDRFCFWVVYFQFNFFFILFNCNLIGSFDFNFTSVMALVPRVAPGQVDNSGSG